MKKIVGHFIALGGGNEIGRSMYALIFPLLKTIFVIDCGFKMRPASKGKDNTVLPEKLEEFVKWIDPAYVVHVFFSHGHNDHIGVAVKLYNLLKERGLNAIFHSTEPTKYLIEVAGEDGIGIRKRNQLPLHYDKETLYKLVDEIKIVRSSDWIDLGNGLRARFEPSGHIRGAASILLETPYGAFLYSGDIQFYDTTLVRGAFGKFPDFVRWLAMDSTNGDLVLPDPEDEIKRMEADALEIVGSQGHILGAGSFSLGRGQDICIRLGRDFGRPDAFNLFAGGLIEKTTDACYHSHWESDLPLNGADDKSGFHLEKENVRWITRREIPWRLKEKPGIFVVTPGMIQAGLALEIFLRIAEDPKSAIFFFGFQAEESNGRLALNMKSGKEITIALPDGTKKLIKVLCKVQKYGISGHADQPQLTNWVQNMDPYDSRSLDLAILVHGYRKGQDRLQQKLLALANRPKKVLVGVNNRPIPLYA